MKYHVTVVALAVLNLLLQVPAVSALRSSADSMVVSAVQRKQLVATSPGAYSSKGRASAMLNAQGIVNATLAQTSTPDLTVFPEFGLYGGLDFLDCTFKGRTETMMPYCEVIPGTLGGVNFANLNIDLSAECNNASSVTNSMLLTVACGTLHTGGAVAYNACEYDGKDSDGKSIFYNTQVVVQNGTLLTKYRKSHPYATACFNTPTLDLVTFTLLNKPPIAGGANFTFGLFTCYDIVFKAPKEDLVAAGVKYFSYSSAIPLVAKDAVKLFSWTNNVTVVASNQQLGLTEVVVDGKTVSACTNKDDICYATYQLQA